MDVFTELVKILSEDAFLLENKVKFLDSLGISGAIVGPWLKLFDMGHCKPYHLIRNMLAEWISTKKDSATIAELRRILREDKFLQQSDKLKNLEEMHPGPIKIPELESLRNDPLLAILQQYSSSNPPPMENTKRPIAFGLKNVVQNFTGREEELQKLNEIFHSGECPVVLVSGLGGIGKTELAKKFTHEISDASGNGHIVKCWLSGENAQSLLNSTSQFCDQLQLPSKGADGQPLPIQEMIQNILKKLKSSEEFGRWVVIIDNVDDIHPEFETALKTLSEFGTDVFLVITSRRIDIFPGELELLEVAKMQLTDSMAFVRKSLKIMDNSLEDAIKSLCEELDNFPLALNQAAAFIRQQQIVSLKRGAYGIQNYLDELAKNEKLGLDKDRKLGYSTATLKVWVITIDKIKGYYGTEGQIALDLLDAMAFINPDNITIQLMHKLYKRFYSTEETDMNQIEDSLTLLQNYSLISSYDEVFNIHRLVQLSLRDRMTLTPPAEDGKSSKDVQLLTNFWTTFDEEEWNQMEMRNVLTIWNHTTKHNELDAYRASKVVLVSTRLGTLGMVNESSEFATEGCKFLLAIYGPEHERYWMMEYSVAIALRDKGQYESALQKLQTVYSKFKSLRGVEDSLTLAVGHMIASCLYYLDMFENALEWGQKVLQSRIKIYGEKNADVMNTKNLVAILLKNIGKETEAVAIFYEIFEWEEANLGANHLSTLTTRLNIAVCFYDVGRFAKALDIFQEILSQREKCLGTEHPDTLTAKGWVADTLLRIGKIDQALKLWEEVAVTREKVLGAEHPETIKAREWVALFKR